jgi:hypothetical protein
VQIPVFKKAVDNNSPDLIPSLKPLPLLVAVRINTSLRRSILYRCTYCIFALSILFAFYPFAREQPAWLFGVTMCIYGLWKMYRNEATAARTGSLGFVGNNWVFEHPNGRSQLELKGEVLCWPWIIILPFREFTNGKMRRLVIFSDAISKEDNARLRAWLRASLIPKA